MGLRLATIGFAAVLATGACGDEAAAPPSGEALYLTYCASCHGRDGTGDGPVAEVLEREPTDLTGLAAEGKFAEGNLIEVIDGRRVVPAHGTRQMPVWGAIFESELEGGDAVTHRTARLRTGVLVDYLRTIQREEEP